MRGSLLSRTAEAGAATGTGAEATAKFTELGDFSVTLPTRLL
jgi:hypothetical protein